ncbi:hypothetical protein FOA52_015355 [Chlamydomonas sp. UWO 241]|nr:hypothetical protein FOA52_015355 [Chlamydomonas sp. UWO 241]
MKASGGPQKLRFTIVSCSGEDADYPVRELLYHSPQTRGWQTPRFCKYPLEILARLEYPSKIQQIQILSHEYKIATKVEVFVAHADQGQDLGAAPAFKRLGYLSFDSNERSNHQARELKSVHVNVPATLLRLVVHRCHVNKLNIYNQVGLIALNLIGETIGPPMAMPPGGYLQVHAQPTREVQYYNAAAADVADLNLDIHVDSITAAKIRELARAKDAAVAREDYDEAKRIKASIDRLKVVGQKIAQLEMRKRAAVEKEDYDTAKLIKADMDKLRAAGESAAGTEHAPPSRNKDPEEIFSRVLRGSGGSVPSHQEERVPSRGSSAHAGGGAPSPTAPSYQNSLPPHGEEPSYPGEEDPVAAEYSQGAGAYDDPMNQTKFSSYDERPAKAGGRYATPQAGDTGGLEETGPRPGAGGKCDIPAPKGWPSDLPGPDALSGNDANEAASLEEVAGEYVARAMYSKNWQLRDAALGWLGAQIQSQALANQPNAFRVLSRVVTKSMKDKVANVFLSALGLFQFLVEAYQTSAGGPGVNSVCMHALPTLLEKLGDTNAKIRDAAKDSVLYIAGLEDAALKSHTSVLLKPVKSQTAFKPVLGTINILMDLVPMFGVSKAGDGFELTELMEWVGKAYNSPNADTRSAAVKLTKEVHGLVGPALRKHIPNDVQPKTREQLDAFLGNDVAPAAAAGASRKPAAAAPQRAPARPASQASSTPKTAASAANRAPSTAASSHASGRAPASRGAPSSAGPPAVTADEPGPYLEEISQREAQHGKDHPRVAETCSNLAILYNQRGEAAQALPLYQRSLAIYEKAYGPEHPDVAHTLTDLAVLHLEQGDDHIGRPLLERALRIQEKALGPDHADVLAIKDVLNS